MIILFLSMTAFVASAAPDATIAKPSIPLAITVDDLPASGNEHPGVSRTEVAKKFIDAFKKHKVPGVYGFVNGVLVKHMAERENIMKLWKEAGHKFGNHTYSHKDLSAVSPEEFIEDIERNESSLLDYAKDFTEIKTLRFPYLQEGESQDKRYALRSYLAKRNYRIAQVSVDFEDWAWGPAFIRCSQKSDAKELANLESSFISKAVARFRTAVDLGHRIYGQNREIKHILLLHMTSMTGHMLDRLLAELKKENVRFISAESAISDPLYKEDTAFWAKDGKGFLIQAQISRGLKWKDFSHPQIDRQQLEETCQ